MLSLAPRGDPGQWGDLMRGELDSAAARSLLDAARRGGVR